MALLRLVGFNVEWVLEHPEVNVRRDAAVLAWAREDRRFLICHDKHHDRATKLDFFGEMYQRGGKVLRIGGDSSQEPTLALAKILMHRSGHAGWKVYFDRARKGGICTLNQDKMHGQTAAQLFASLQTGLSLRPKPQKVTEVIAKPPKLVRNARPPRQKERLFAPDFVAGGGAA